MIQANGIIKDANGVTEYANPLINIYMNSSSKFTPTIGVAQVGKIVTQGSGDDATQSFNIVAQVGTYEIIILNPSFEQVQDVVLYRLVLDYPEVTFTIVA